MGAYQIIFGVLLILFIIPLWIVISHTTNLMSDTFTGIVPAQVEAFTLGSNVIYYYLFFVALIIFIWIYKSSMEEQKKNGGYYG